MTRLWATVAFALTGFGLGIGCHHSSSDQGSCNVKDQTGCKDGLVCQMSMDGSPACLCSTDMQTGCGDGLDCYNVMNGDPACYCSVDRQTGCDKGMACESIPSDGTADCFTPITVSGEVFDLATGDPIEGAIVVARDVNNAAVSGLAVTDADGNYKLAVPTPRKPDGTPVSSSVTLRADAAGYLTFPRPPRQAIPVDTSMASGDPPDLSSSATDIALIALPDSTGLGSIAGTVKTDRPRGTVVVAGGGKMGGGVTGIADYDGTYTVFNVPAGTVGVQGYKAGQELDATSADVKAGALTSGVDLEDAGEAIAVVSGSVDIVNPGMGRNTSVILAVEETFDPVFASGEAPPGLRVGDISGAWRIQDVPDGNYVALAAFENDFLVRDPDTSIAGTDIVHLSVSGGDVTLSQAFKITGSLDDPSPDGEEVVMGTPTLTWDDDSGEDHYEVVVYDAFGNKVWEKLDVPGVSGSPTVQVMYGGPALQSGMIYQFRATSIKHGGTPLARTEDLRGVWVAG